MAGLNILRADQPIHCKYFHFDNLAIGIKEEIIGKWTFTVSEKFTVPNIHEIDSVCTHKAPNRYIHHSFFNSYIDFNFSKGMLILTLKILLTFNARWAWKIHMKLRCNAIMVIKKWVIGQWCITKEWLLNFKISGLSPISNMFWKISNQLQITSICFQLAHNHLLKVFATKQWWALFNT